MAHDERDPLNRRQLLRGIVAGAVSLGFVAAASADVRDETYASSEDVGGASNESPGRGDLEAMREESKRAWSSHDGEGSE